MAMKVIQTNDPDTQFTTVLRAGRVHGTGLEGPSAMDVRILALARNASTFNQSTVDTVL